MNLSEREFKDVRNLIEDLCGICLGEEKRYLIQSRLEPVMHRNKIANYSDLVERCALPLGLRLRDEVVEAITTKETSFNRDGHPFEELRKSILPDLVRNRLDRQHALGLPFGKLRIWSAAASSGQEVYSIGIAILEWLKAQSKEEAARLPMGAEQFQILGSDISNDALRSAKDGIYSQRDLDRGADCGSLSEHFVQHQGAYAVSEALKRMVEFRRVNLTKPLSDTSFYELILCRNILIYFDEPTRNLVLKQLVDRLSQGGVLMLGAAESLVAPMKGVTQMQFGRTTVYRKA